MPSYEQRTAFSSIPLPLQMAVILGQLEAALGDCYIDNYFALS